MAGFDPDAYLTEQSAPAFDPDAYLTAEKPAPKPSPSAGEAFQRHAVEGLFLGTYPRAAGLAQNVGARQEARMAKAFPQSPLDPEYPTPGRLAKWYPNLDPLQRDAQYKQDWLSKHGFKDWDEYSQALNRAELDPAAAQKGEALRRSIVEGDREAFKAHPLASIAGGVVGGAPLMVLGGGGGAPGLLGKMAAGAKTGAGLGALAGWGSSDADSAAGTAGNVLLSSLLGGGVGAAVPAVASGLKKAVVGGGQALLRLLTPEVKTTPEAARLLARGIPLTTGQRNPESFVNAIEQVSDKGHMGVGPQRDAAQDAWRNVVLREPLAPGQAAPGGGTAEQLESIYQGFRPQYGPIKAQSVPEGALSGLPEQALKPHPTIDARTRAAAAAEIKNALTILPEEAKPTTSVILDAKGNPIEIPAAPSKPTTVESLLKVRENIREQLRAATKSQDFDRRRILQHAADTVTGAIDSALSPDSRAALQATDARYHLFNVVEDAANRSGLAGEFTPKQLGAALKVAEGRRAFTQGGGGALRDLAGDANAVFSPTVMPTGMRASVAGWVPKWGAAPLARLAQTRPIRDAMLRTPVVVSPVSESTARRAGMAAAQQTSPFVEELMRRLGLSPAYAEGEGQ